MLSLLALQPFLLTDWGLVFQDKSPSDLGYSMKVARGELLKPWSLWDLHTLPYLYHWTSLVAPRSRLAAYRPLCPWISAFGVWKPDRRKGLILLWIGIYFAVVGGLHTKPVRYLLPLLPFLALLAADRSAASGPFVHAPGSVRVRKLAIVAVAPRCFCTAPCTARPSPASTPGRTAAYRPPAG